jgi:hypothetical protein
LFKIEGQSPLEDFGWQIPAAFTAERAGVNDPGIGHCLDRGGDVLAAAFALDHKIMEAFWRAMKHESHYSE